MNTSIDKMFQQSHDKSILLIEDREDFSTPLRRWLKEEGYDVKLALTYSDALSLLDNEHFHLAIVDIRLVENDDQNEQGLQILDKLEEMGLKDILPCIVLSAHPTVENILKATQELGVWHFIEKETGYRKKLLKAIQEKFDYKIKINFALQYDDNSQELMPEVITNIEWPPGKKPRCQLLTLQTRDLFGKLFVDAKRLHISKLKPGLTGAAIVHARPTWDRGVGPSYVVKVSRRDKIAVEEKNYCEYVEKYIAPDTIARVDKAYSRHLGAIVYTFAERDGTPLDEFDHYYQDSDAEKITNSLRRLFNNTCGYWYDHRERRNRSLPKLYYNAFQLTQERLVESITEVLPHFEATQETLHFEHIPTGLINPIAWLTNHANECVSSVYHSITHGDLTGRNILVDKDGRCWLIDFYRTYESHILRDFVILETDIKYRLLPQPTLQQFLGLERALFHYHNSEADRTVDENFSTDLQKALKVISSLRSMGHEFARGVTDMFQDTQKEYLLSLLMGTLNVVRLRHIEKERKLQAMLSAALICAELDQLAGRTPVRPDFTHFLE